MGRTRHAAGFAFGLLCQGVTIGSPVEVLIMLWRIALIIAQIYAVSWTFKLMLFNIWAAGGPPVSAADKHTYEIRAYGFMIAGFLLIASTVFSVVLTLRKKRSLA
jgi:hypothetical protein